MNIKLFGGHSRLFILLTIVWVLLPGIASAYPYIFRAYVDGESDLMISENTVQWHNLQWDVPGITSEDGENYTNHPTTITTADMDVDWYPEWSGTSGDQFSKVFSGLNLPFPTDGGPVALTVTEQRVDDPANPSGVYISQIPDPNNSYTLIVKFDDAAPAGAAWYTIELETASAVPVPGSIWLLGSGILGLAGLTRKIVIS